MTCHLTTPRNKATAQSSLLSLLGFIGAVSSFVGVGGCQPKPVTQAPVASQSAEANAPVTEAAPQAAARAPREQPHSVAKHQAKPKEEASAAAGKVISIAGGWVNAGGACDSGASVFFNPDGTYMSEGEKGTWALSGKTLTVTTASTEEEIASETQGSPAQGPPPAKGPPPAQGPSLAQGPSPAQGPEQSTGDSGEKAVLTLLSVTEDAARVILSNGSNANWTRCTS